MALPAASCAAKLSSICWIAAKSARSATCALYQLQKWGWGVAGGGGLQEGGALWQDEAAAAVYCLVKSLSDRNLACDKAQDTRLIFGALAGWSTEVWPNAKRVLECWRNPKGSRSSPGHSGVRLPRGSDSVPAVAPCSRSGSGGGGTDPSSSRVCFQVDEWSICSPLLTMAPVLMSQGPCAGESRLPSFSVRRAQRCR